MASLSLFEVGDTVYWEGDPDDKGVVTDVGPLIWVDWDEDGLCGTSQIEALHYFPPQLTRDG